MSNASILTSGFKNVSTNILKGISCTLIAIGGPKTGKSHCIFGKEEDPGILDQVLNQIFSRLEDKRYKGSKVTMSVVDVANETITDALSATSAKLELREDLDSITSLTGQVELPLDSSRDFNITLK